GVQNHADDGSARIKIHLRGDETIDDLVDAQFAAEGGDDWQVIGLANVDVFGNVSKLRLLLKTALMFVRRAEPNHGEEGFLLLGSFSDKPLGLVDNDLRAFTLIALGRATVS
ncbi:MAG: hypothetical protein ACI8T1_005455, partial [Verrucomicrobiales bacterium]